MMNLFYEPFPDTIPADGSNHKILTDFRDWLKFIELMKDEDIQPEYKLDFLRNWFAEVPVSITKEMYQGLREFCEAKLLEPDRSEPERAEMRFVPPSFDWCIDAQYIIADFRRFYSIDLLKTGYLHWWEFLFLTRALPDESQLYRRAAIRTADLSKIKDPDRKRAMMEAQMRISIPFEVDDFSIGAAFR